MPLPSVDEIDTAPLVLSEEIELIKKLSEFPEVTLRAAETREPHHIIYNRRELAALWNPYIQDGKTVVSSPHKVYGPETNDLVLQLRKQGIDRVVLAGMSANLCTESHMRELIEQGFEVLVVTDATAGAITEHYNGYAASLTNFRMIASAVDNTTNTVRAIKAAHRK